MFHIQKSTLSTVVVTLLYVLPVDRCHVCIYVGLHVSVHGHLGTVGLAGDGPGYNSRRLLWSRQWCRAPDRRGNDSLVRRSGDLLRRISLRRFVASRLHRLPEGLSVKPGFHYPS